MNVKLVLKNFDQWVEYLEGLKSQGDEITLEKALDFKFECGTEPIY